jgi:hypothetical protein
MLSHAGRYGPTYVLAVLINDKYRLNLLGKCSRIYQVSSVADDRGILSWHSKDLVKWTAQIT